MSEAKHTPGKWQAEQGDNEEPDRWYVTSESEDGRPYLVAMIHNGMPGDTLETEAYNARLISAAPDLLKACELAMIACRENLAQANYKNEPLLLNAFDACKAAIRKAEGQQ